MTNNSVRAFSIGIIFSTAILSAIYYFSPEQREVVVTDNDLQNYIKSENLVVLSEQEYEELKELSNKKEKIEVPSEEPAKEPVNEEEEAEIFSYILTIEAGMNSRDIAELLAKENIIKDASDFDAFLTEQNLNTSIQIGSFELNSGMSFEVIADVITN